MIVQAAQPWTRRGHGHDGRFLKRDGKLTTIDMAQLSRDTGATPSSGARKGPGKEGAEGINELFTR